VLTIVARRHPHFILIVIRKTIGQFSHNVWLDYGVQELLHVKNFVDDALICTFITQATRDDR